MDKLIARWDLEFLLYEVLKAEELCTRERFADHSRQTFDDILNVDSAVARGALEALG